MKRLSATSPPPCHPPGGGSDPAQRRYGDNRRQRQRSRINKAFNWNLPEDEARTINGIILEALEEIPVPGTRVRIEQYDIDILDVRDNMIKQVKVMPVKSLRESVAE